MKSNNVSRRDVLKTLATGAAAGSVLQVIPAAAAEYAHDVIRQEKSGNAAGKYTAKYFNPHQYQTVVSLCDAILPKDEKSGGAVEGGAPEFIDLLTSENEEYQRRLGGGLIWLDSFCADRFGKTYLEGSADERKQVLDLIAYRKNALADSTLNPGVEFFAFFRDMTCDGYYTSKIGIEDLQYIGNVTRHDWPGCPPLPE